MAFQRLKELVRDGPVIMSLGYAPILAGSYLPAPWNLVSQYFALGGAASGLGIGFSDMIEAEFLRFEKRKNQKTLEAILALAPLATEAGIVFFNNGVVNPWNLIPMTLGSLLTYLTVRRLRSGISEEEKRAYKRPFRFAATALILGAIALSVKSCSQGDLIASKMMTLEYLDGTVAERRVNIWQINKIRSSGPFPSFDPRRGVIQVYKIPTQQTPNGLKAIIYGVNNRSPERTILDAGSGQDGDEHYDTVIINGNIRLFNGVLYNRVGKRVNASLGMSVSEYEEESTSLFRQIMGTIP